MRLVRMKGEVRMEGVQSRADHTAGMRRFAARKLKELEALELSGFVLKKDSPSCGMERVRVYGRRGAPSKSGRGLFAEALLERFPRLPVEEEERLGDPQVREEFLQRVLAYRRVKRRHRKP